MKYPYIGKFQSTVKLFFAPNQFLAMESGHGSNRHEINYTNITHEYLSNTWGIAESKEHAEFIILLANTHGFIDCGYGEGDTVFLFKGNKLVFIEVKDTSKSPFCAIEANQITIPLPPKAKEVQDKISYTIKKGIQAKKGCEDFELTGVDSIGCVATVSVSFNDNDEIANVEIVNLPRKDEEWPQVGDNVCWGIESSGVVKSLSDGFAWIKKANNDYITVYTSSLIKPKSKQDLLIEGLQTKLCNNNAVDSYILACDIVNGEIEGLSYDS